MFFRYLQPFFRRRFSRLSWLVISLGLLLITVELILRFGFGLSNPVLLQADCYTGYRFQPNQSIVRFGKRMIYNQFSQRSESITAKKPPGVLRILMLGDSVLNGGNPIDQADTISQQLQTNLQANGLSVQVLDASAGSWGIGNAAGYLQEFGTFESDSIIWELGSHDFWQTTSTSEKVGKDPNFPDHRPTFALQEAWVRYAFPRLRSHFSKRAINPATVEIPVNSNPTLDRDQIAAQNRQSFKAAAAFIQQQQIPLFALLVPEQSQLIPAMTQIVYKDEFVRLATAIGVTIIDVQPVWASLPPSEVSQYFRDNIHLSSAGNHAIAQLLLHSLCQKNRLAICAPS